MEGQNSAQFDLFRDFLSFMERQRARPPVTSAAVSSSAPVQPSQRFIYTAAPSGLPYSAVNPPVPSSLPAPVSGSRGVQGQQGRPLFSRVQPEYSALLRRATLLRVRATRETGLGVHPLRALSVRVCPRR